MSLRVTFATQLPSQWSFKMIKVLLLRLNQCLGPFTMSPVEQASQRELLDIYLSTSFVVRSFGNTLAMSVIFLWKCSKLNADSKNAEKNSEKIFCFWDKCLWIVSIELFILIREYLSSAVNVLTKSLKTFHLFKSDFSDSITFTMINQSDKGALIKIETVFSPVSHVICRAGLLNGSF